MCWICTTSCLNICIFQWYLLQFTRSTVASLEKKGKLRKPWACPAAIRSCPSLQSPHPLSDLLDCESVWVLLPGSPEYAPSLPGSTWTSSVSVCPWAHCPPCLPPSLQGHSSRALFLTRKEMSPLSLPSDTFYLRLS